MSTRWHPNSDTGSIRFWPTPSSSRQALRAALLRRPIRIRPSSRRPNSPLNDPARGGGDLRWLRPSSACLEQGIAGPATDGTMPLHIDDLLRYAVAVGASDLHLTANMPGAIRLHGAIRPIEGCPVLSNETIRDMVFGILPASQRERFEEESELDTSHSIAGVGRFRVNVSLQRGTVAAALRPIPHDMPEFDTLGIPESVKAFTELRRGLVLVTGPTGSGKSTTLASLIDIINRTKPLHIVTVEDPIEFLHDHKRSIITQREIGEDTESFCRGPAPGAPPGPRCHPGRRAPRPGDHLHGPDGGGDRPPGLRHAPHPGCAPDHRPDDRRVPDQPTGADPGHAGRHARRRGDPAADRERRRDGAGALLRGTGVHIGHPEPDPPVEDPPDLLD